MAQNPSSAEVHLSVQSGRVTVVVGDTRVEVSTGHLKRVIKLLKVARDLVKESSEEVAAPERSLEAPSSILAATPPDAPRARHRRGRLADALVIWMQAHPGWHNEGALLDAVISGAMTDANPKRAMKISLGRKVGDLFATDGAAHWKLVADRSAGPPPPSRSRARRGRKTRRISRDNSHRHSASTGSETSPRPDLQTRRVVRVKKGARRPTSGK